MIRMGAIAVINVLRFKNQRGTDQYKISRNNGLTKEVKTTVIL